MRAPGRGFASNSRGKILMDILRILVCIVSIIGACWLLIVLGFVQMTREKENFLDILLCIGGVVSIIGGIYIGLDIKTNKKVLQKRIIMGTIVAIYMVVFSTIFLF